MLYGPGIFGGLSLPFCRSLYDPGALVNHLHVCLITRCITSNSRAPRKAEREHAIQSGPHGAEAAAGHARLDRGPRG